MGITKFEFSPGLLQRLFNSNSMIVAKFTSRKTFFEPVKKVEIGISNFDKDLDSLLVFKNSIILSPEIDYTIDEDNRYIISTSGSWGTGNASTIFDFIVLKNIKDESSRNGLNIVDGVLLEDGSITLDKLSPDMQSSFHALPSGGYKGSILMKKSDADYDVRWTTNTICNVVISTFDNKEVTDVSIQVRNLTTGTSDNIQATGSINQIELKPGNRYEISLSVKDGYKTPPAQIVVPILGNINTIFFMYDTEKTSCVITLETEDNTPIGVRTLYIRRVADGSTKEIKTDGVTNVYQLDVNANTQYEIYSDAMDGYITPTKKVINTTSFGISNVLIRYAKDEVFCDVEVSGIELSPTNYITVIFKDLKTELETAHRITSRTSTINLKSKTSYEVRVVEDKEGVNKPQSKFIRTAENKSNLNLPLAFETSNNIIKVVVKSDDKAQLSNVNFNITDGMEFNKMIEVGESGIATINVSNNKSYTLTFGKVIGYIRPTSQVVNIKNQLEVVVNVIYKKINTYGFELDLTNSDPNTNITYIEDSVGYEPMKVKSTGVITMGDWLNTFLTKDIRPVAMLKGKRIGYLSEIEEGRLESGDSIPNKADIMVEFKKMYYMATIQENRLIFKVSNTKVDNTFNCNAFLSEVDGKTECDYMYYGMYEAGIEDEEIMSKGGLQVSKFTDIEEIRALVKKKGEGYNIETISKLNLVTLITMLVSKCSDIKAFTGKPELDSIGTTSMSYKRFNLILPNRTINSPIILFYINNLFNSPRFIEGCFLKGLKEIRHRKSGPYKPETTYKMLSDEHVHIGDGLYTNHVKSVFVSDDIVYPVYDAEINDATSSTYLGSTIYAQAEPDINKKLVLNNQSSNFSATDPGYFNYCFITNAQFGARLTFTKEAN